jgi:hypothetical protein
MIQRIQSLYLLMTTLLSILFLKGSFLSFADRSGSVINVTFNGIIRHGPGDLTELLMRALPISVFMILIPVLALITIFIYKNRKIQILLSLSGILFSAGFIILSSWYMYIICNKYNVEIVSGLKIALPVIILILNILAYRGIRHDDRLVKSYDRLR